MEKFSMFVPVEIIEKAGEKKDKNGLPDKLLIGGVASNSKTGKDTDGQTLDVNGFDYAPLLRDGYLNLEHGYAKSKDASLIVGLPTNAFIKNNEFHIEGELFKDNPKAVEMYKLGQILKKAGSTRRIGYSIEGFPKSFDPNDKSIIKSAIVTGVALTLSPKNAGTECIFKGGEIEYETQENSAFLVDLIDESGQRIVVDKELNILKGEDIEKSIMAGSITGRETTDKATTGEATKKESLDGDKKKKKKDLPKDSMLSKAEVITYLISEHSMDIDSCKSFWNLSAAIQGNLIGK